MTLGRDVSTARRVVIYYPTLPAAAAAAAAATAAGAAMLLACRCQMNRSTTAAAIAQRLLRPANRVWRSTQHSSNMASASSRRDLSWRCGLSHTAVRLRRSSALYYAVAVVVVRPILPGTVAPAGRFLFRLTCLHCRTLAPLVHARRVWSPHNGAALPCYTPSTSCRRRLRCDVIGRCRWEQNQRHHRYNDATLDTVLVLHHLVNWAKHNDVMPCRAMLAGFYLWFRMRGNKSKKAGCIPLFLLSSSVTHSLFPFSAASLIQLAGLDSSNVSCRAGPAEPSRQTHFGTFSILR